MLISSAQRPPNSGLSEWRLSIDSLLRVTETFSRVGYVHSINGAALRARGVVAAVGELCELRIGSPANTCVLGQAQVIGVQGPDLLLTSLIPTFSMSSRVQVVPLNQRLMVPIGDGLLGRVLNGYGQPIDDAGPISRARYTAIEAASPPAMKRQLITRPLLTGVRAIDALSSCGQGQRLAIFSPAGAGKSSLIGALARQCRADVVVLALVGERGREVGDFVREELGPVGMQRTVVLASSSDKSVVERIVCAQAATSIAEHFRAQGKHVLLLVDSITRLARAQRELALACGEPLAGDGFPPSVLAVLAPLVERAGTHAEGAISAFYTVLTENDRGDDPIAEEVRSIVDGHIVLSRALADVGHFPAIDTARSISRIMPRLVSPRHMQLAQQLRALLAKLDSIELLIQVGEYRAGSDAVADRAIALRPAIERFLRQQFSAMPSDAIAPASAFSSVDLTAIQAALEQLLRQ